ncbi:MAG: hypothetical protein LC802_16885 [Acidobacteria bacterium]|nr:hypothetical protein [Acidobacteriota bacterium]
MNLSSPHVETTRGLSRRARRGSSPAVAVVLFLLVAAGSARAQTVKLESGWEFLPDKTASLTVGSAAGAEGWRAARVGLSWNAQFEDLRDYMGVAWYRARFAAPELGGGRRALLRFGAVDYFAEVYVNGKKAGEHEGGYMPFHFDVTDSLKPGANELLVRVTDPPMDEKENLARFPSMLYKEIPHGKQNWYVQTGGIWQPVWLEVKPRVYISDVKVFSRVDGTVGVVVRSRINMVPRTVTIEPGPKKISFVEGEPADPALRNAAGALQLGIEVRVIDPQGASITVPPADPGTGNPYFTTKIPNPQLWSPDHPRLYTVEVKFGEDTYTDRFGFRSFEARDGKFYLNGEPYYMLAALDQDFYPETIYTAPSEGYIRDQMLKAKRLGLNLLRCHIKVCEPSYLKIADEVGMLVWYEIPSWNDFNHFSPKAAERGEHVFRGLRPREESDRGARHPRRGQQRVLR